MDNKDEIICRCQEVTRGEIEAAIEDGATTVEGVKKRTRAGMGLCQGKTCQKLVMKIIAEKTGQKPADIVPPTFRPPVRPVRIGVMEEDADE